MVYSSRDVGNRVHGRADASWLDLTEPERESITAKVGLLEERGPQLGDPHTSQIKDEGLI
jgi:hypothetical protein